MSVSFTSLASVHSVSRSSCSLVVLPPTIIMPTLLVISSEWLDVSIVSESVRHVQLNRFIPIMFSYSPEVEPRLN
jgi:hypothetical protein